MALGLLLAVEGLLLLAFPKVAKEAALLLAETPTTRLQVGGAVVAAVGIAILWAVR